MMKYLINIKVRWKDYKFKMPMSIKKLIFINYYCI